MLFEMRQYMVERGRMQDNHARMEHHLPALLKKHGIQVVGRWVAQSGPRLPMFCYIMEWVDHAEREARWAAFYSDPEWARVRAKTNAGSELVEGQQLVFMKPNPAFEQTEADLTRQIGGVHQIISQRTLVGYPAEVGAFLSDVYLPRLRAAGAHVIGVCDLQSGPSMPSVVMILAWKDPQAFWDGWRGFNRDAAVIDALGDQRRALGATYFTDAESFVMEPASYALPFASLRTHP